MDADDTQQVFTRIWETNSWGSEESRSGRGSEIATTEAVRLALETWLHVHPEVRTLLDAPCGDFNWMQATRFPHPTHYIGGDIVPQVIEANRAAHSDGARDFVQLDVVRGPLPAADAWLCRDVLTHLPFAAGVEAVGRFRDSTIPWFLATTFPAAVNDTDISAGGWHYVNLCDAPYGLGAPEALLRDPAENNQNDRFLGIWLNPRYARQGARRLTIVTVVYEAELHLLALQARSLARHMRADDVAEIIVIGNESDSGHLWARFRDIVLPHYGTLAGRVRFVAGDRLLPGQAGTRGWFTQQLLKLRIAAQVATADYLVLDAKNLLIAPASRDSFLAPDGRARSWRAAYRWDFQRRFEGALRRFGLDPDAHVDGFPPTITPIVLNREAVLSMIAEIRRQGHADFDAFFMAHADDHSEFLLYHAYLASLPGGIENACVMGPQRTVTVFGDKVRDDATFASVMWQAEQPEALCFGVHRSALEGISAPQRARLADFLMARGVIDIEAEAGLFLRIEEPRGG